MTHPAVVAHRYARRVALARDLTEADADDAAQDAALEFIERYDPTRSSPQTFAARLVGWRLVDDARRESRNARFEKRIAYEQAPPETPEEISLAAEQVRVAAGLATSLRRADLALLLDERPLRVRAKRLRLSIAAVCRRRQRAAAFLRAAALEAGL